jgi:diaminopimelate decarboxylase
MENLLDAIVDSNWKTCDGEISIGSRKVSWLAERYETPLFIYDQGILQKSYDALRDALPANFAISYSVKANPNPAFLSFFLNQGCGLEIASIGEFHLARGAGCLPENIVFAGPGKTEAELEVAIAGAVGEIHAESELEIERIRSISNRLGLRTPVALRVNPTEEGQGGAMRMGGKAAPFGVDEERLDQVLRKIAGDPLLEFRGIHLFAGTQILDYRLLLAQYRKGLEIARRVAKQYNLVVHTLDFGGGLGVPYFAGDQPLDLSKFGDGVRSLMASIKHDGDFKSTRFMVEPGRFLVAEAGIYVTRINDIKISRGKKYLICDGGMNHHLAASGNLGQVLKRNFPMALLNKMNSQHREAVDVVGPLCTPLDTLARSITLPPAEVGDLLGIFQSGAYARSASPMGFLSHLSPPEVWVESERNFLVRRRGTYDDNLRDVQPPPAKIEYASAPATTQSEIDSPLTQ